MQASNHTTTSIVLQGPPTTHGTHNGQTLRGYSMLMGSTVPTNREDDCCWQAEASVTPPNADIMVISDASACNERYQLSLL